MRGDCGMNCRCYWQEIYLFSACCSAFQKHVSCYSMGRALARTLIEGGIYMFMFWSTDFFSN